MTPEQAEATGIKSERRLAKATEAAAALRQSLAEFEDDEELLRDTIEGETNLHEMIAAVVASIDIDNELVTGIGARAQELSDRKHRLSKRIDRKRALVEQAMAIGEIRQLELAEATLSLKRLPPKVIIEAESDIPSSFWKPQAPKLDKSALTKALREGEAVIGASLDNGGISLQIRRK